MQQHIEEGKYFSLFPEDAIVEGNNLIGNFHRLRANNFYIVEYDVPEELVLKSIGDYTTGIMTCYIMETYIQKTDLIGEITSTEKITNNKKIDSIYKIGVNNYDDKTKIKRIYRE